MGRPRHAPVPPRLWQAFWTDRCPATRGPIVEHCLWLVDAAVRRVAAGGELDVRQDFDLDDLRQAAIIALWRAVDRYRPGQAAFETYVWRRLIGEAGDEVRRMNWLDRGQDNAGRTVESLDRLLERPGGGDRLADDGDGADAMVERVGEGQALAAAMATLPARHVEALRQHFFDGMTLAAMGARAGITESAACHRVRTAVGQLRVRLTPLLAA